MKLCHAESPPPPPMYNTPCILYLLRSHPICMLKLPNPPPQPAPNTVTHAGPLPTRCWPHRTDTFSTEGKRHPVSTDPCTGTLRCTLHGVATCMHHPLPSLLTTSTEHPQRMPHLPLPATASMLPMMHHGHDDGVAFAALVPPFRMPPTQSARLLHSNFSGSRHTPGSHSCNRHRHAHMSLPALAPPPPSPAGQTNPGFGCGAATAPHPPGPRAGLHPHPL